MTEHSIFKEYYQTHEFVDRYASDSDRAITVLIPVLHTNELWEANLKSIYREIPVHTLLIGDGGCIDDSIEIAKRFPRVEVLDHRSFRSLGYSLRKLIEAVRTDWFAYLHSDVYLPDGWFDRMYPHREDYDWFGCRMQHTIMVEYDSDPGERPYIGTQIGRTATMAKHIDQIDDDFVYRQEEFVLANIVALGGGKEGRIDDVFHYHQTLRKPSPWQRTVTSVHIDVETSPEEEFRTWDMQLRGIVKYLEPTDQMVNAAGFSLYRLFLMDAIELNEFYRWVAEVKSAWLPYLKRELFWRRLRGSIKRVGWLKSLARRFMG